MLENSWLNDIPLQIWEETYKTDLTPQKVRSIDVFLHISKHEKFNKIKRIEKEKEKPNNLKKKKKCQ